MSSIVSKQPLYKVRNSRIHGRGVFAARRIRKGTRIMEYLGDRISHAAADARYDDHDPNDNHTFLFMQLAQVEMEQARTLFIHQNYAIAAVTVQQVSQQPHTGPVTDMN